jgi:hypothetical protein
MLNYISTLLQNAQKQFDQERQQEKKEREKQEIQEQFKMLILIISVLYWIKQNRPIHFMMMQNFINQNQWLNNIKFKDMIDLFLPVLQTTLIQMGYTGT